MSKGFIASALLLFSVAGSPSDVLACGDKFLLLGRGTRFQRLASAQRGAILVYLNPSSNLPKALSNLPFDSMLRKAGHRAAVVTVPEELARIVRRDKWDVVVIDVADGEAIKSLLSVRETSPVLLPVVDSASDNNLALVKKEYGCVLESPAKTQSFMDAIDAALALKETTRQKSDAKLTR